MKPAHRGLARIARAAGYSWRGFRAAWRHEAAFRQECMLAAALAPCAFWVAENPTQAALLLAATGLVLVVELVNSAIEATVDRFSREPHPLAGRAKDMGSAAVFASLALAGTVWALVLADRLRGFWG